MLLSGIEPATPCFPACHSNHSASCSGVSQQLEEVIDIYLSGLNPSGTAPLHLYRKPNYTIQFQQKRQVPFILSPLRFCVFDNFIILNTWQTVSSSVLEGDNSLRVATKLLSHILWLMCYLWFICTETINFPFPASLMVSQIFVPHTIAGVDPISWLHFS